MHCPYCDLQVSQTALRCPHCNASITPVTGWYLLRKSVGSVSPGTGIGLNVGSTSSVGGFSGAPSSSQPHVPEVVPYVTAADWSPVFSYLYSFEYPNPNGSGTRTFQIDPDALMVMFDYESPLSKQFPAMGQYVETMLQPKIKEVKSFEREVLENGAEVLTIRLKKATMSIPLPPSEIDKALEAFEAAKSGSWKVRQQEIAEEWAAGVNRAREAHNTQVLQTSAPKSSDPKSHDSTPASTPSAEATDLLLRLSELHKAGVLSDDEFALKKAELLDRI